MSKLLILLIIANACRFKVVGWFRKKYSTPREAMLDYGVKYTTSNVAAIQASPEVRDQCIQACEFVRDKSIQACETVSDKCIQTNISLPVVCGDTVDSCMELQSLSIRYASICQEHFGLKVPSDFIVYSGAAMVHLANNSRSNVLYSLAKGFGTL